MSRFAPYVFSNRALVALALALSGIDVGRCADSTEDPHVVILQSDVEQNMIGSAVAIRVDGQVVPAVDLIVENGGAFEVTSGTGIEQWKLRGRATTQSDGAIAFDALVKCGKALVRHQLLVMKPGETQTMFADGQFCEGKRKRFEADVRLIHVKSRKAGVLAATRPYTVWLKVFVDELGAVKSAEFLRTDPPRDITDASKDDLASSVLSWTLKPEMRDGKPTASYRTLPLQVD